MFWRRGTLSHSHAVILNFAKDARASYDATQTLKRAGRRGPRDRGEFNLLYMLLIQVSTWRSASSLAMPYRS
jgi:hypothetical protein